MGGPSSASQQEASTGGAPPRTPRAAEPPQVDPAPGRPEASPPACPESGRADGPAVPRSAAADPAEASPYRLLGVREAATLLGFSVEKTRHLVRRGHLPTVTIGRRLYIPERMLASLTRPSVVSAPEDIGRREAPKRLAFTPKRRRS